MSDLILSIESSCDETACALLDYSKVVAGETFSQALIAEKLSTQVELHKDYGGVVPELASREHIRNLPLLYQKIISENQIDVSDIKAISVTAGPGLKGCLLVGVSFAKGLGLALGLPVFPVNHLEAHVLSGLHNSTMSSYSSEIPALVLLVSGGHTQVILVEKIGVYKILASTQDDAAGEAFDKIGSLLGLGYPAGKTVSDLAKKGKPTYPLPKSVVNQPEIFSFSGLKTAASRLISQTLPGINDESDRTKFINDFCASLEDRIVETLVSKTEFWLENLALRGTLIKSLMVCGGVAANEHLRKEVTYLSKKHQKNILIPPLSLCTDNAAMVAIATTLRLIEHFPEDKEWVVQDKYPVLARWPINEVDKW